MFNLRDGHFDMENLQFWFQKHHTCVDEGPIFMNMVYRRLIWINIISEIARRRSYSLRLDEDSVFPPSFTANSQLLRHFNEVEQPSRLDGFSKTSPVYLQGCLLSHHAILPNLKADRRRVTILTAWVNHPPSSKYFAQDPWPLEKILFVWKFSEKFLSRFTFHRFIAIVWS